MAEHAAGDDRGHDAGPIAATSGSDPWVFSLLTPLLRGWKLIVGLPFCAGVVAAAVALLMRASYTASATFVPAVGGNAPNLPGGLAGLASQIGISVGTTGSLSPDFFSQLLLSRELLGSTLVSPFDDPDRPGSTSPLLSLLDVRGATERARMDEGVRTLSAHVATRVDRRTGIVTLGVTDRRPGLAAAVANRMVELLNIFNLEQLQSQSRERRRFAQERRDAAERELRAAEAQHLRFLESNRRYGDSPLLSFEENRLSRQVQLRQDVFQTLTREFEEARIAEVRDTPVLTIIDRAVPPDRRTFPKRKLIVFLGMVAGALTAVAIVYWSDYRRSAALEGGWQYRSFQQAWTDARSELLAALRLRSRG